MMSKNRHENATLLSVAAVPLVFALGALMIQPQTPPLRQWPALHLLSSNEHRTATQRHSFEQAIDQLIIDNGTIDRGKIRHKSAHRGDAQPLVTAIHTTDREDEPPMVW